MPSSDPRSAEPSPPGPFDVQTGEGRGRFFVAPAAEPRAVLFLGHGAGGGVDAVDLDALARGLPARGITVVRFEQPWRTAGGRVAVRPPRLDAAWTDALEQVLSGRLPLPGVDPGGAVFVGGRSAGARVACRSSVPGAAGGPLPPRIRGVLACAFPLHPPGRPERSRIAELTAPEQPRLVLQGDRDSFGSADDVRAALADSVPAGSGSTVSAPITPPSPLPSGWSRSRAPTTRCGSRNPVRSRRPRCVRCWWIGRSSSSRTSSGPSEDPTAKRAGSGEEPGRPPEPGEPPGDERRE